jgi:hypothetical protein
MVKGLVSNKLNTFGASELSFENSGVGSNGTRSSRIRKTKKKMNTKADDKANDIGCIGDSCASIGRFGTCGPGAAYRVPRRRPCLSEKQINADFSNTGIAFDSQMSGFNTHVPQRKCCPPILQLGSNASVWSP